MWRRVLEVFLCLSSLSAGVMFFCSPLQGGVVDHSLAVCGVAYRWALLGKWSERTGFSFYFPGVVRGLSSWPHSAKQAGVYTGRNVVHRRFHLRTWHRWCSERLPGTLAGRLTYTLIFPSGSGAVKMWLTTDPGCRNSSCLHPVIQLKGVQTRKARPSFLFHFY